MSCSNHESTNTKDMGQEEVAKIMDNRHQPREAWKFKGFTLVWLLEISKVRVLFAT